MKVIDFFWLTTRKAPGPLASFDGRPIANESNPVLTVLIIAYRIVFQKVTY